MQKHIDQFIKFQKIGKSPNTIDAYRRDLQQFSRFLEDNEINITELDKQHMRLFLKHLVSSGASSATVSRKISVIRNFEKYLLTRSIVQQEFARNIKFPKIPKKIPHVLTVKQVEELLALPDQSDLNGFRDYFILFTLYAAGLRISELLNLARKNVDEANQQLKVTGKGNKQRLVPLTDHFFPIYSRYIGQFEIGSNDKLISGYDRTSISRMIRKYIKQVASEEQAHPHILRHSCATHMLNAGAPLIYIKEFLGHKNLQTTTIYTHVAKEHLKAVYNRCHPRANIHNS